MMKTRPLIKEAVRSGSIAAVAMVPFGLGFFLLGFDVNEYGRAVIQTFFGGWPPPARFLLFILEHFLISWTAAVPLLVWLDRNRQLPGWLLGLAYGAGFWLIVNSLLLPFLFGRPTPWQIGWQDILPSLVVHLVYGVAVSATARPWRTDFA